MAYPYDRRQIQDLFRRDRDQDDHRSPRIAFAQFRQRIREWLFDMEYYGYDFRFMQFASLPSSEFDRQRKQRNIKTMRRKVYGLFDCPKCRQKGGRRKRWSSNYGLFEIKFSIEPLDTFLKHNPTFKAMDKKRDKPKYPFMLLWKNWLYREQCKDCKSWGFTFLHEDHLEACLMQFGRIVSDILDGVPRPQFNPNEPQERINDPTHLSKLCQACQKGVCPFLGGMRRLAIRNGENRNN